ncbi:MAG: HlyC/CorC family transporter [Phycisphaerae bacterium]|nr:HlyC/CorC family transporter [Phycisphaerae bacterium]
MNPTLALALLVVCLLLAAILGALVQSLRDLSRSKLEDLAAQRNRARVARRIDLILDDVEGHASAMALPRVLFQLSAVVLAAVWIASTRGLDHPAWPDFGLGVLVASVLVWLFGAVLPQAVARHAGEETVYAWSRPVRGVYLAMFPARAVVRFFDEVVRRLAGRTEADHSDSLEHEILSVVEEAQQSGAVDQSEREMIQAVVRFRDTTVGQIMTPRTEIEALELTNNLGEVTAAIRRIGHSRIPVFENDLDHIVGIFYVKDLMRWMSGETARAGKTFELREILRPPVFVPETKTIRELLRELLQKRVHIAVVADEFGGTAGLVTVEDIMEELVGDITDEYEQPPESQEEILVKPEERAAELDGRAYIDSVNDRLRSAFGVQIPESEDYDTVAGFVVVTLGRIPAVGETFVAEGVRVTVLAAEPRRVKRVRVEVLAERPIEPEEPEQPSAAAAVDPHRAEAG